MICRPLLPGLLLLLLLAACAGTPGVQEPRTDAEVEYQSRNAQIAAHPDWSLKSRLGLDDGQDGGSGTLDWVTAGDRSTLSFRGTLGKGAWRLSVEPGLALLQRGDGSNSSATGVDELVWRELGWQLPVDALSWWVRGMAAPGLEHEYHLGINGLPHRIDQAGWVIEFSRYEKIEGLDLPRKLEAVNGNYKLKMSISRWHVGSVTRG